MKWTQKEKKVDSNEYNLDISNYGKVMGEEKDIKGIISRWRNLANQKDLLTTRRTGM